MSNTYRLVNPYIEGDLKNQVKSDNSVNAAKVIYKNLSQHFNNSIPKFYFTIQKGSSGKGKYYHFVVKEKRSGDEVKFNLEPYVLSESEESMNNFERNLNEFKTKFSQAGGVKKSRKSSKKSKKINKKKIDDDSSDSITDLDSSEEFYRQAQTYRPVVAPPLYYMWYDPQVYKLDSVFIPTFYSYVYPFIELKLNN